MPDSSFPQDDASFPPLTNEGGKCKQGSGALQSRNIRIHRRRTSVRLEPVMWNALNEIAGLEKCSIHDLCSAVHDLKERELSFTAALRVFMVEYYRSALRAENKVSRVQLHLRSVKS